VTVAATTSGQNVGAAAPASAAPAAESEAALPAGVTALLGDSEERDVRIETGTVVAVFTNRGARLKSWRLKHYLDARHEPLELVVRGATSQPLPFSIQVADAGQTTQLNNALFVATRPAGDSVPAVRFEYRDSAGLRASKEFALAQSGYTVQFTGAVQTADRAAPFTVQWGPGLGAGDGESGRYGVQPGGLLMASGKVQRLAQKDVAKQPAYTDDVKYAGVDDHYFLTAAIDVGRAAVTFQPVTVPPPAGEKTPLQFMAYSIAPAAAGAPLKFYVGPKDFDELAAVDRDLVRAINFGIWAFLIVPLLRSLNWIHSIVGNYGWSIVILTILINALMFPLRHKSVVSMRKMQEIQPEAKAIQDRYAHLKATDPAKQKMNQELMALYRERGINPASGCVPMLLTLPVLFGFYSLLTTAIELRGAPFGLWIQDLSAPDRYYVTPILMGLSQLWQQRLTPQTGVDPAQQKMMMFMPLVFTFIFFSAPSGAVVYWLVSNGWQIGQQYVTNYLIGPPTIRAPRPAAERRMKRVGSSKTPAAARED
jgi:YidC/Oxa1 family membrane protein insertase